MEPIAIRMVQISTHAPPEGSDAARFGGEHDCIHISTHAPPEGSDLYSKPLCSMYENFNPRSP